MTHFNKQLIDHIMRLKQMGWTFIALGIFFSGLMYSLPTDSSSYWLSEQSKEGIYVLSLFFGFLGVYCLASIRQKRHFL